MRNYIVADLESAYSVSSALCTQDNALVYSTATILHMAVRGALVK